MEASLPLLNRGVFPGDVVGEVRCFSSLLVGAGVVRQADHLLATRVGLLRYVPSQCKLWVENDQKRYLPALGDHVIGVVVDKNAEEYRLDIAGPLPATLPLLAFDGASNRNRPLLGMGALVYCRVTAAHREMETELTCKAPPGFGAPKDWVTRECVFGELQRGHVFDCAHATCCELLDAEGPLLDALAEVGPFELAVGVNGRIWVDAEEESMVVLVQAAILQSQGWSLSEIPSMVKRLAQGFSL